MAEQFEGPTNPEENDAIINDMKARAEQAKRDSASAGRRRAGGGKAGVGANAKPSGEKVDIPNVKPKFRQTTVDDVIRKLKSRGGYSGTFATLGTAEGKEYGRETLTRSQQKTLFKKFNGLSDEEVAIAHAQGVFRPYSKNAEEENALFASLMRGRKQSAGAARVASEKAGAAQEEAKSSGAQSSFESLIKEQPGMQTPYDTLRLKMFGSNWRDTSHLTRGFGPGVSHSQEDYGNSLAQVHDQLAHLAGMSDSNNQPTINPQAAAKVSAHLKLAMDHLGKHYLDYAAGIDEEPESQDKASEVGTGRGKSPSVNYEGTRLGSIGHLKKVSEHLIDAADALEEASPELKKTNISALVANVGNTAVSKLTGDLSGSGSSLPEGRRFGREGEIYPTHINGEPFPDHVDTPTNAMADAMVHQARNDEYLDNARTQRELEGGTIGASTVPAGHPSNPLWGKLAIALAAKSAEVNKNLLPENNLPKLHDKFVKSGGVTEVSVPSDMHRGILSDMGITELHPENVSGFHSRLDNLLRADATETDKSGNQTLNKKLYENNKAAIYTPESGKKLMLKPLGGTRAEVSGTNMVSVPTKEYASKVLRPVAAKLRTFGQATNPNPKGFATIPPERPGSRPLPSFKSDLETSPSERSVTPDRFVAPPSGKFEDRVRVRGLGLQAAEETYREGMSHDEHMDAANNWLRSRGIYSIDLRRDNWDTVNYPTPSPEKPETGEWSTVPSQSGERMPASERPSLPTREYPKSTPAREFAPTSKFLEPGEAYFGSPQVQRQLGALGTSDEVSAREAATEDAGDVQARIDRLFKPRTRTGTLPANPAYTGAKLPAKKPSMSEGMLEQIQAGKRAAKAQRKGK